MSNYNLIAGTMALVACPKCGAAIVNTTPYRDQHDKFHDHITEWFTTIRENFQ
jgi:hypothetical protein